MKLGINDSVNTETKKAALRLMDSGPSKVDSPNSHSSNPIHKAATAESKKDPKPAVQNTKYMYTPTVQTEEPAPTAGLGSKSHELNKIAVAVGGLAFWTFR